MSLVQETPASPATYGAAGCPVDHQALSTRKATRGNASAGPPLARDAHGVWHVHGFEEARAILRSNQTRQAGFRAEMVMKGRGLTNQPILYQEGKVHQEQRKQTARFFTPKTVSSNYRQLMERLAEQLVGELRRNGRADLARLSLSLSVQVAAQVIGLTNSSPTAMGNRLDAFFQQPARRPRSKMVAQILELLNLRRLLAFYWRDVRPAIRVRKAQPQEDLISHLIAQRYRDPEILTECITYGAAGMATTREFISMAAWHFLEHPALRARFLPAGEEERQAMLHEILRVEPVIGRLHRRATGEISLVSDGVPVVIPADARIALHVEDANVDETVVGANPLAVCPGRPLHGDRVGAPLLSFGDGHHRCPGNFIAIQETDIFLQRLLALPGLRIERPPTLTWNDVSEGYELRRFILALDPA